VLTKEILTKLAEETHWPTLQLTLKERGGPAVFLSEMLERSRRVQLLPNCHPGSVLSGTNDPVRPDQHSDAGEPDDPSQQSKVEERTKSPNVSRAQDHYKSDTRERILSMHRHSEAGSDGTEGPWY